MARFTTRKLIWRSLTYYWRTNLAVALGVFVGMSVIAGALVVGHSVRASLAQMTEDRLGEIDHVLIGGRFFLESLPYRVAGLPEFKRSFEAVAPALSLTASLEWNPEEGVHRRASQVQLWGVNDDFWRMTKHGELPEPKERELYLNKRAADQLGVEIGAELQVWVEVPSTIPRDTLLGDRDRQTTSISVTLTLIIDDELGVSRLGFQPNQQLPLNAFMALRTVQEALEISTERPSRSLPLGRSGRCNVIAIAEASNSIAQPGVLNSYLKSVVQLEDLGLKFRINTDQATVSLESDGLVIEDPVVETVLDWSVTEVSAPSPVLMHLANQLSTKKEPDKYSMYSTVVGLDLEKSPPFGPFESIHLDQPIPIQLGDSEILLNEWVAKDLNALIGDTITLRYHQIGSRGDLPELVREFELAGIVRLTGPANDRKMTPEVPGITDVDSFQNWRQPFPMEFKKITPRDEEYWDQYRATPKAFVSLKTAQSLWASRHGKVTSIRLSPTKGFLPAEFADRSKLRLATILPLDQLGLQFTPIREQGLKASQGTTDFGGLFFGFSLFLILSAALLVSLLFRLNVERRTVQIGLMQALGFTDKYLTRIYLYEGLGLVSISALAGILGAIGYAWLMIFGLRTWWYRAVGTQFLELHLSALAPSIGYLITWVLSILAIYWGFRGIWKVSIRGLLAGQTPGSVEPFEKAPFGTIWRPMLWTATTLLLVLATVLEWIPDRQAFDGVSLKTLMFFVSGLLAWISTLSILKWVISLPSESIGSWGLFGLALRNASRARARSLLTVGMVAAATFLIVVVMAARRNPAKELPDLVSGNGGFTLVAESDRPLLFDLNTTGGREAAGLNRDEVKQALASIKQVVSFRVQPGDDASCLNLYQTTLPTILGVPKDQIDRGGFLFSSSFESASSPWQTLNDKAYEPQIPVLGDMNTLLFSLHKGVGTTVSVPNEEDPKHELRIAGMLQDSVFQGVLLMSEEKFFKLFPERIGFQYFLIDCPPDQADEIAETLESELNQFGFDCEKVSERLSNFLAVQNTYLSTFQVLGGLGLLLGTFGLGTVMLRNIYERQSELALMRAIGFRAEKIVWVVVLESAILLIWGLIGGTISALLAMFPHILAMGSDMSVLELLLGLFLVFAIGLLSTIAAARNSVQVPILEGLRSGR